MPFFCIYRIKTQPKHSAKEALVWSTMSPNSIKNLFMINITFQLDSPVYILTVHKALGRTAKDPGEKLTEEISQLILKM